MVLFLFVEFYVSLSDHRRFFQPELEPMVEKDILKGSDDSADVEQGDTRTRRLPPPLRSDGTTHFTNTTGRGPSASTSPSHGSRGRRRSSSCLTANRGVFFPALVSSCTIASRRSKMPDLTFGYVHPVLTGEEKKRLD